MRDDRQTLARDFDRNHLPGSLVTIARPAHRILLHVDMDAFYASIEQRDQPELRGRPVVVGSPPNQRGVVSAASYEARRYGIRSAMASSVAGRLCPHAVFLRPRMAHYRAESEHIMRLLEETGGRVERVSIDEAYVDLTDQASHMATDPGLVPWDDPLVLALPWARQLKRQIRAERSLAATIGISSNKLMAKLASDFAKPDGLILIPDRDKAAFLRPLPTRCLHGVGSVTEQRLADAGLRCIGDIQDFAGDLRPWVGGFAESLRRYAWGEDSRPLEIGGEAKTVSSEETFLVDTMNRPRLRQSLREQAEDLERRLRGLGRSAYTIQVKVRYANFTTVTRQVTLAEPIESADELYRAGAYLLRRDKLVQQPLRLLGLGASRLTSTGSTQLSLFPWEDLARPTR